MTIRTLRFTTVAGIVALACMAGIVAGCGSREAAAPEKPAPPPAAEPAAPAPVAPAPTAATQSAPAPPREIPAASAPAPSPSQPSAPGSKPADRPTPAAPPPAAAPKASAPAEPATPPATTAPAPPAMPPAATPASPAPRPPAATPPASTASGVVDPGGEIAVPATRPGAIRVGAEKCRTCHKVQYTSWSGTAHAKRTPPLDCESCHGPGSEYKTMAVMKDAAKAKAAGLVMPPATFCATCHRQGRTAAQMRDVHAHKGAPTS